MDMRVASGMTPHGVQMQETHAEAQVVQGLVSLISRSAFTALTILLSPKARQVSVTLTQ
ncbi:hypothetical protein [Pararhodobacter sp.]|uniref:hypothetical protein n=1 Tax=Pararhodobacter sp. TaxID=2127056 RepID=UPI002AFF7DEE|nr:hypothetical protein [Pararhodobacter sp.]